MTPYLIGVPALEACEQKVVTPALDRVIEANTLLSGLGFESGGLVGAHSIHDAFTIKAADVMGKRRKEQYCCMN